MQNFISMIMNSLKSMSLTAIIDILVVAFIFYKGYMLIKETRAEQLLKGIAFIIILIPISSILNLSMLYFILSKTLTIGIISVVIIFQPEIRRALEHLGRSAFEDKHGFEDREQRNIYVSEIVNAVSNLAETKTGALIAIEQGTGLGEIIASGTIIEAKITSNLLENIFVVNTPLHDGATIIGRDKILAAGLDVYENEPKILPALLELDNVVLAPHAGTKTSEARDEMGLEVIQNILGFYFDTYPVSRVV